MVLLLLTHTLPYSFPNGSYLRLGQECFNGSWKGTKPLTSEGELVKMKMAMWARKALAMFCFMMLLGGVGTLDKANADSILPDGTFLNPIGTYLNLTQMFRSP